MTISGLGPFPAVIDVSAMVPQSSLPGVAPAAESIGRGRKQNTKAAQQQRLADAATKREALAAKRSKPRKTRSDKGVKRGPRAKK